MSDTNNKNTMEPSEELIAAYASLRKLSGQDSNDTLRAASHYLQVYSIWCQKLPCIDTDLLSVLNIKDTDIKNYTFYDIMIKAYLSTSQAGDYFQHTVLESLIGLGKALHSFALVASDDDGLFSQITKLLNSITKETSPSGLQEIQQKVLRRLNDLQEGADKNSKDAKDLSDLLNEYQSQLNKADARLEEVRTAVEECDKTSQKTIDKLTGTDPALQGKGFSLAELSQHIQNCQNEYQRDVTIASTSVTYSWVFWPLPPIPVGLIAAVTVASIYGSKARAMSDLIKTISDNLKTATNELKTAVATHAVQQTAKTGLDFAVKYTDVAIGQTNTIQSNWEYVTEDLSQIHDFISRTTFLQGGNEMLEDRDYIISYLNRSNNYWQKMMPLVEALIKDSHVNVIEDDTSSTKTN